MGTIKKQAKNIIVKVKNKHTTFVGGTLTKTADKISIEATNGNLTFSSNKKINIISKKGIKFGEYTPPEEREGEDPKIVDVQFIDKNNTILSQSSIKGIEGGNATDFLYGKKLKIKIITKEIEDGKKIDFKLKGNTKSPSQDFFGISKLDWELEVKNNECETELFTIPMLWYCEDFEKYDYTSHKTTIKADDLNAFMVEISVGAKTSYLPKKDNWLKPIAYRRNYEELIGLFKTDNSGDKDLLSNYENKLISSNSKILSLVKDFSEFLQTEDLTINDINRRVQTDAKQLWNLAVKQVQSSNLDDRPLYWARNKMQVRLKRHPLFKDEIDFETSIICKDTELESIIILFEELSRNYTGVDFSNVVGKKVLITGFDPFILNSFKHPNIKGNILQSNPSGCVALSLSKNNEIGANIQTLIVPVRYTDFDGSTDPEEGQGEGVVEKYIKPFVDKVDMIITISQAGPKDFNIDKYATATRGGFNDNSDFIRVDGSHAIKTDDEWIETTLPKEMTNAPFVKYNWNYDGKNGELIPPKVGRKISYGPGGSYLSNEIFYRVAKLRKDNKPALPTGHFHISKIQENGEDLNLNEIKELLSVVKQAILEGIKAI
ncbi:hypothetical protein G1K66_12130 [Tenacibaculum finnmarkense]|uniref:hypothetical protein n=1 Tax=Tenacibaculum finnmarkense TaxID=2781243 RepID=UPI001E335A99|nr:hypothetical protein [Tenacibaculum finnmarkense]MCD8418425.1 hypothetical protein [Tenacibaculum finnmarkense genomovar finnmarkense]MCD8423568.1 hypothetical protein [Tenacibaculum finnmarkense genomovar ulcerans]MCG8786403.1 hypothetical protein [Tenacibaculum finnmarkense]MCG8796610.1 hypothetical protein [Tenacibaculum finnmarkense]MCG8798933.1 hypothetical protein [Tenacibaculum finnmarkense]